MVHWGYKLEYSIFSICAAIELVLLLILCKRVYHEYVVLKVRPIPPNVKTSVICGTTTYLLLSIFLIDLGGVYGILPIDFLLFDKATFIAVGYAFLYSFLRHNEHMLRGMIKKVAKDAMIESNERMERLLCGNTVFAITANYALCFRAMQTKTKFDIALHAVGVCVCVCVCV